MIFKPAMVIVIIGLMPAMPLQALATEPPLRIALTNDDGWQAEGIQVMYRALSKAGHEVTMVAPADQQRGREQQSLAGGSRGGGTVFGIHLLRPGLREQDWRGTAVAAISRSLNGYVPAIAVSTDEPALCKGEKACIVRHYEQVSAFIVIRVIYLTINSS